MSFQAKKLAESVRSVKDETLPDDEEDLPLDVRAACSHDGSTGAKEELTTGELLRAACSHDDGSTGAKEELTTGELLATTPVRMYVCSPLLHTLLLLLLLGYGG